MDASDAVVDIGGVAINLGVDVNGVVGVGGGDSPASLDIGTVDALSASLHARQDSLPSGGRRRNLGSDDKFTHILLTAIGNERRKRKYFPEYRILYHDTPVFLHDLIC